MDLFVDHEMSCKTVKSFLALLLRNVDVDYKKMVQLV